jgi:hypothetical protein
MLKSIDVPKLETWKANFSDSKNNPEETESAVVSLELLQRFLDEAKVNSPGFNGVRIYFIRYAHPDDELIPFNGYVRELNDSLSQVSLAFVPVKHFDPATLLTGIDFVQDTGQIHTLAVCHPTDWPAVVPENGAMQTSKTPARDYGMQMEAATATKPPETIKMKTTEKGTGLCPPRCVPPRT